MKKFSGHYIGWRESRINKIIKLFGKEYFKNKTLLELGCGFGHIGLFFQSLGAKVLFSDGRKKNLDVIRHSNKADTICIDQDEPWKLKRKFDVILHMGVLYHLENWQQDLECALNHSNLIVLESEVANRSDPNFSLTRLEPKSYDQALNGLACRVSASNIEKELTNLGASFERYDDKDLNSGLHTYDWKVNDKGPVWEPAIFRRFWIVRR